MSEWRMQSDCRGVSNASTVFSSFLNMHRIGYDINIKASRTLYIIYKLINIY